MTSTSSSRKHSRSQLLINLATGNNTNNNQRITSILTSDDFFSNSYDPTQLIPSYGEANCNNEDTIRFDICNGSETPLIFEELQVFEYTETTRVSSPSVLIESMIEVSDQLPCTNSIVGIILDETTGKFTIDNGDVITDGGYDENYYLDENTGQFLLDNEINFPMEENNMQFDFEDTYKDEESIIIKKREICQKKRLHGEKYTGRKRKQAELDDKPSYEFVEKPKKCLLEKPCAHLNVAYSSRSYLCGSFSEAKRKAIFDYFWGLTSWDAKKAYLKNLVRMRTIMRRRKENIVISSQKQLAYDYVLTNDENEVVKVCKNFFRSTLNIHCDTLSEWIKQSQDKMPISTADLRLKHEKRQANSNNGTTQKAGRVSKSETVKEWLALLPKVQSHYCRASSTRVYVEDTFESKSHMYRIYKEWCSENGKANVARKCFNKTLKEEKISIYKPRKDQCDVCVGKKEGNVSEEEYALHIIKKEEAYKAHIEACAMSSSEVLVLTIDVQGVLLCPKLLVSAQYYKTKLQMHNYSIYVNNNKEVYLYVWHEGDGGVTANEFTSCIVDFIKSQVGYKKICIISDGCSYQNRNKILSSALLKLSYDIDVEIEQIILEKGHTMMKVDSVHSTLEQKFRPPIYAPTDYVSRMSEARPRQPYHVNHVDFKFFKNYEASVYLDSIRPGKRSGDSTVNDLRALLYKKGVIHYKLRHSEDWQILPQRVRNLNSAENIKQLYDEPRKIEKSKYESLQSLKTYMHRDYHTFYDNLRY